MFTAILTAASGHSLDKDAIDQLGQDWQVIDQPKWLDPTEAVMLNLSEKPDDFDQRWSEWQSACVDINLIHGDPQHKRILIADMDGTMIEQECLDELAEIAGFGQQVKQITARAMNGELNFEMALRERVALLKNQSASIIDDVLSERISLMPGGPTLLATMKQNGAYAALISGGFTPFTQYVSNQLGFNENHGNQLIINNGKLTGEVADPIKGKASKRQICLALSERFNIPLSDIMGVGDGANDLDMLNIAGMGVAFHAKPVVASAAQWRINHGDLTTLLYLQGYQKAEFIFKL